MELEVGPRDDELGVALRGGGRVDEEPHGLLPGGLLQVEAVEAVAAQEGAGHHAVGDHLAAGGQGGAFAHALDGGQVDAGGFGAAGRPRGGRHQQGQQSGGEGAEGAGVWHEMASAGQCVAMRRPRHGGVGTSAPGSAKGSPARATRLPRAGESLPVRQASHSGMSQRASSASSRKWMPGMGRQALAAGTMAMPRPAATMLRMAVLSAPNWTIRGWKSRRWKWAMTRS